jgi:hypothetical protein
VTSSLASRTVLPTLVWLGALALALASLQVVEDAAIPLAAGGAVIALSLIVAPLPARILAASAMLPLALLDSTPAWAWVAGAVALGLATALMPRGSSPQSEVNGDLRRHLAWCRRREEPAHLLLAPLDGIDEGEVSSLLESFRITDSVTLGRGAGGSELYALLDAHGFVREGLERRLAERFEDRRFGWATFPQNGVTLQTLIEHARIAVLEGEERVSAARAPAEAARIAAETSTATPTLTHATGRS